MSLDPSQLLNYNELFSKEVQNFKKDVIDSSINTPLEKLIKDLKKELTFTFTEQSRTPVQTTTDKPKEVTVPTSDLTLVKKIAGVKNTTPSKSYAELDDGIIFAEKSKNSFKDARMSLEIQHSFIDQLELQYMKAREFFSNAVFAIPNSQGGFDYFKNNGYDPGNDLKIKCSKYTGTGIDEPFGGFSPQRRFEQDALKGKSTWTLKQRFLEQIPNNPSFINLSTLVNDVKQADINSAKLKTSNIKNTKTRFDFDTSLDDIENGTGSDTTPYRIYKVFKLIDDITLEKDIRKSGVVYKIVTSNFSLSNKEDTDFLTEAKRQISFLKISNMQQIIRSLEITISNFLKKVS